GNGKFLSGLCYFSCNAGSHNCYSINTFGINMVNCFPGGKLYCIGRTVAKCYFIFRGTFTTRPYGNKSRVILCYGKKSSYIGWGSYIIKVSPRFIIATACKQGNDKKRKYIF